MASPWQELEIEPTGDVVAIRRAYRARLGRTRPEEAARLLAAYEGAIAALPVSTGPTARPSAASGAIDEAITQGRAVDAAALIVEGRALSTLTLRHDIEAVEQLIAHLTTERTVTRADIERVAEALGWFDDARALPAGAAFIRLRARLAAERWLEGLREAASRPRLFDARAAAARLLIGAAPTALARVTTPRSALVTLLSEFDGHREWIEGRLDQDTISDARRMVGT